MGDDKDLRQHIGDERYGQIRESYDSGLAREECGACREALPYYLLCAERHGPRSRIGTLTGMVAECRSGQRSPAASGE